MKYKEYLPHPSLQDHVKCFWTMEREYTNEHPAEDVTPDAFIELIVNFGAPYVLCREGAPDREMPAIILVGLQSKPLVFRCDGTVKLVAARFYAWGALPFLADSARGLNKLPTNLGQEWEALAARIEPSIREHDDNGAIALVEDHLITRLLTASVDLGKIQSAAKMLYVQKGQFRAADLAENCNLSSRQLQRQFKDVVGVSAKTLARSIRFEEVRKRLVLDPDQSLTELAYEYGYADQAHFIHDFKEFADRTPGEFAHEMKSIHAVFRNGNDHVVFLQSSSPRHR